MSKILVVQIAGLGHDFLEKKLGTCRIHSLRFRPVQTSFPAVTCSVQASIRTASVPATHGVIGNGFYSRDLQKPFFWEQSSSIIQGQRIWDHFRESGGTVGQLFWQQSLGRDSDVILSPAPIHKHHGGMIQVVFSRPKGLYSRICKDIGRTFNLAHYWGPRASRRASDWIIQATQEVMRDPAPDLLLTYIPHLDYVLQRHGPDSDSGGRALRLVEHYLAALLNTAADQDYKVVVFGDYAITPAKTPLFPNKILRKAGLFCVREVTNMIYADLYSSRAFGMVDHQICHVITKDPDAYNKARELFRGEDGCDLVLGAEEQKDWDIAHKRSGDIVLSASPDFWFAYPWWNDSEKAPDYATHVDIHNKPGYDPAELFWGLWPISTSQDATRIKGTHGSPLPSMQATWATNVDTSTELNSLRNLNQVIF